MAGSEFNKVGGIYESPFHFLKISTAPALLVACVVIIHASNLGNKMSQILDELADNIANLPPRDRLAFLTRMEAASISDPQKDRIKKIQAAAERNPAPLRFALAGLKRAGVTLDQLVAGNGLSVLDQAMAQKHFDESSRWALKAALRQAHAIG